MSEILRRKLRPAHEAEVKPHALVDQAWRLALARALREGAGLAAEATAITSRACDLVELPELPAERALLALLDGPGGAMGVAALSPELTASLIEMQTIGRVANTPPGPRRPTRTDAAMVSPVLDRALARFDFLVSDLPDRRVEAGFRFASALDDARSIGLLLDDLPYHLMRVTLSLAEGARTGEVLLALPLMQAAAPPQLARAEKEGREFAADLGQTECELQAVLARRMVTLSEVMQLAPGQVMTLNDATIANISLRGIDGKPVASARLGQQGGHRALRISAVSGSAAQAGDGAGGAGAGGAGAGGAGGAAAGSRAADPNPAMPEPGMGGDALNHSGDHSGLEHSGFDPGEGLDLRVPA